MNKIILGMMALAAIFIGVMWAASTPATLVKNAGQSGVDIPTGSTFQEVYVRAMATGFYEPTEVKVKKGEPVRFHFSAESRAGCGKEIILDSFGLVLTSYRGEESVGTFIPQKAGTYAYHCSMNMFRGKMVVV